MSPCQPRPCSFGWTCGPWQDGAINGAFPRQVQVHELTCVVLHVEGAPCVTMTSASAEKKGVSDLWLEQSDFLWASLVGSLAGKVCFEWQS